MAWKSPSFEIHRFMLPKRRLTNLNWIQILCKVWLKAERGLNDYQVDRRAFTNGRKSLESVKLYFKEIHSETWFIGLMNFDYLEIDMLNFCCTKYWKVLLDFDIKFKCKKNYSKVKARFIVPDNCLFVHWQLILLIHVEKEKQHYERCYTQST